MRSLLTHRRGSALFITMIICAGFAVLTITAMDRMVALRKLTAIDLGKQRAAAAADTVAAMIESKLMDAAADYAKLVTSVDAPANLIADPWWKLKGCVYKDANGRMRGPGHDQSSKPLWINNCLVRWMVEPVRVYSKSWSTTPGGNESEFAVNPPRDATQSLAWATAAMTGPNGEVMAGGHNKKIGDFYHFRIVAQAYALEDGSSLTSEPWNRPTERIAASQSLRILQIQSLQLFKYALFYAADAPIGDLDLQTGGAISVQKGAVHSNGAIYIRGGESNGFFNRNWHWMASGDDGVDAASAAQNIFLGDEKWPITITGVEGIFRMGKTANHLAAQNGLQVKSGAGNAVRYDPNLPMLTPTEAGRFLKDDFSVGGGRLDLNGDQGNSNRHRFNGVNFTRDNDSRTKGELDKVFKHYARDSSNGGVPVRTLQNIASLGGRPFEPQAVVSTMGGVPNPLYGSSASDVSRYARTPAGVARTPLYYAADPYLVGGNIARPASRPAGTAVTVTTDPGGSPPSNRLILAEEMRLWWDPTMARSDVLNPSQEIALYDNIPAFTGTGVTAGGSTYILGSSPLDQEQPVSYNAAGVLVDPAGAAATGVVSFPGVGVRIGAVDWDPKFFGSGFSPREVKGPYLEAALFGGLPVSGTRSKQQQYYLQALAAQGTAVDIPTSGLVIRERRWQQVPRSNLVPANALAAWNHYWPGPGVPGANAYGGNNLGQPIARPELRENPTLLERLDYVQYLCSQYTVLFCGRNITAPFFAQILSKSDWRDFIVSEDEFVDQRESGYMWGMYGANGDTTGLVAGNDPNGFFQHDFFRTWPQASTVPGGGMRGNDYTQNVLTIHMRALQEWLRETPMSTLGYASDGRMARERFTGVLYTHRTRRSESMHPLLTPELDWPGMQRHPFNVEDSPVRLVNQTHLRGYWFNEVLFPTGRTNYPPVNFPWNWREPAGPLETTRCATRLKGQLSDETSPLYYKVFWDHAIPEAVEPLGTSAFTYITPQRFYMWGHFCYKVGNITDETAGRSEIDANMAAITPCAVFADNYTIQSAAWRDENAQVLPTRGDGFSMPDADAISTCQFVSMVINNSPNAAWNCGSFGSAGQEGTFRMMEDWGYDRHHVWWSGSQVVMNMGRYHHSGHNFIHFDIREGRAKAPAHMGIGAFHTGQNHYIFNTNLFSSAGRPPLSPSGVTATRVVNQISNFGE